MKYLSIDGNKFNARLNSDKGVPEQFVFFAYRSEKQIKLPGRTRSFWEYFQELISEKRVKKDSGIWLSTERDSIQ